MHDIRNCKQVGRVAELWRYPVKSMAAEPVPAIEVGWHGLAGDRRWAFVRSGAVQSGFPWLTLRERHDLNHYHPSFVDPARPDRSPTNVQTPSGAIFDVADPTLAAELYPEEVRVIRQDRGVFDSFPLSIITTETIGWLGGMVDVRLDVQRFRPNILVNAGSGEPFAEDGWLGCVLRIGGMRMRVDKRDSRCIVITIDPVTTERDPRILRTVAGKRQGCMGVYGTTVERGRVAAGDPVFIESPA